uniref:Uncharacterized protein n=1 Tax=Anguilla anguilla TaxID=7936 RepID=A0A0E9W8Z6_ANGAN
MKHFISVYLFLWTEEGDRPHNYTCSTSDCFHVALSKMKDG